MERKSKPKDDKKKNKRAVIVEDIGLDEDDVPLSELIQDTNTASDVQRKVTPNKHEKSKTVKHTSKGRKRRWSRRNVEAKEGTNDELQSSIKKEIPGEFDDEDKENKSMEKGKKMGKMPKVKPKSRDLFAQWALRSNSSVPDTDEKKKSKGKSGKNKDKFKNARSKPKVIIKEELEEEQDTAFDDEDQEAFQEDLPR